MTTQHPTLYICRGLPASGKSSWARALVVDRPLGSIVRLNRDDLRTAMFGDYTAPCHPAEEAVTLVQHGPVVELLRRGVHVVVDDTNLRARHARRLLNLAVQAGAVPCFVDHFLEVGVDECVRRDADRVSPVGEDVIRGMAQRFLPGDARSLPVPLPDQRITGTLYEPKPCAPAAVMVDIDGTVALHGDRDPYDTSRYHQDGPNRGVIDAVRMAAANGWTIVFCSGRSEEFRAVTEDWLREHVLPPVGWPFELHMRPAGDLRNDAVVKLELFDQHIRDRYDVRFVLDDRDRVVDAWRSIGLTVFQVAPGAF